MNGQALSPDTLRADVDRLGPWFHNLKLPDGQGGSVQTRPDGPFGDFPQFKWDELAPHLPSDLSGQRCLDIGTNSGFYAFELARRGATVLGIDLNDHYLNQARFARRVFGLEAQVDFENLQIYQLAAMAQAGKRFDLVIFMGVFYHLRYPLLGLDCVRSVLKPGGRMVFQTLTMPGDADLGPQDTGTLGFDDRDRLTDPGWPKMAFFERGFTGDPTNWWAANHAGCRAMLRSAGFAIVAEPGHELFLCEHTDTPLPGLPDVRRAEYEAALTGLNQQTGVANSG